jgi:hypothetical protein
MKAMSGSLIGEGNKLADLQMKVEQSHEMERRDHYFEVNTLLHKGTIQVITI